MSAMQRATSHWIRGAADDELPEGITFTAFTPESGRAASRKSGMVHIVTHGTIISDGSDTVIAAVWLCGGSTLDAMEIPDDDDPLCTNCQLAQRLPSKPCVYRAWSDDGTLLYIGSTINAVQRVKAHSSGTHWWPEVARLAFEEYPTEAEARKAESTAIWNEPSTYNRGGTRRKGGRSTVLDGIEIHTTTGDVA